MIIWSEGNDLGLIKILPKSFSRFYLTYVLLDLCRIYRLVHVFNVPRVELGTYRPFFFIILARKDFIYPKGSRAYVTRSPGTCLSLSGFVCACDTPPSRTHIFLGGSIHD
jgi:hypothetical protein